MNVPAREEQVPEVPRFAESYPRDPALDALVLAFARGDYGRVHRDAPALLKTAEPVVRDAARDLLARTRPDPLSHVFFLLTAGLLVFLSAYWWWHAGTHS